MIIAITSNPRIDRLPLAKQLAKQHGLELVDDPSKALCKKLGYQTLYDIPSKEQPTIRLEILQQHLELAQQPGKVFAYSAVEQLADWARWLWSQTTTVQWQQVVTIGQQIATQYDHLYWAQQQPARQYDGFHWLDQGNAKQIDSLIPYIAQQIQCEVSIADHD